MDGDQCPGCGSMRGCSCTPATIRAQLIADRAELSDRVAGYTTRANTAARLLRDLAAVARSADRKELADEAEEWLRG